MKRTWNDWLDWFTDSVGVLGVAFMIGAGLVLWSTHAADTAQGCECHREEDGTLVCAKWCGNDPVRDRDEAMRAWPGSGTLESE